jgi:hypothetical protein
MTALESQLLREIAAEDATRATETLQLLTAQYQASEVSPEEALSVLENAICLAKAQGAHLRFKLRSLDASRVYWPPADPATATWHIEG